MTYPTLPFALVSFLADISTERAQLSKAARHATVIVHHDKSVRSARVEITEDAHFSAISDNIGKLCAQGPFDTIALIYSTAGDDPLDVGILLGHDREPTIFEWTYAPAFGIKLQENDEARSALSNAEGRALAEMLLGKKVEPATP
ncbi:hypothetical protein [Croceicoccus gelatinilyticus]|uniref:hypothetical protein n=1 Tax=Croceicoccus gelatinilyticus TaxID=2835536 RepID=UPI001BCF122E|nr:hypothetical protein [Croceicoccus gelatinilyticus]MBS7671446.1 hypothetical protein [Croceicoccus gelatinilyticus]